MLLEVIVEDLQLSRNLFYRSLVLEPNVSDFLKKSFLVSYKLKLIFTQPFRIEYLIRNIHSYSTSFKSNASYKTLLIKYI